MIELTHLKDYENWIAERFPVIDVVASREGVDRLSIAVRPKPEHGFSDLFDSIRLNFEKEFSLKVIVVEMCW